MYRLGFAVSALVLALAAPAGATTINFQDLSPGNCAYYGTNGVDSGGFHFVGNPADPALFGCTAGVVANNTSNALLSANDRSIITMTRIGGAAFDLNSFFAGNRTQALYYGVSTGISLVGQLAGGGTVTGSISFLGNAFTQFSLTGFNGLSSVTFTALGTPLGNGTGPEFVIDDIVVDAVPEPAMLGLFGLGALGLGLARRRPQAGKR